MLKRKTTKNIIIYRNIQDGYSDENIKCVSFRKSKRHEYCDIDIIDYRTKISQLYNFIIGIDRFIDKNETSIYEYAQNLAKPSKELSESGGMCKYLFSLYPSLKMERNTIAYVIADGRIGLTGYILYRDTDWKHIVSFDPAVEIEKTMHRDDQTFSVLARRDDTIEIADAHTNDTIVIIGVHTHGNTRLLYDRMCDKYKGRKFIIAIIPCCVPKLALLDTIKPKSVFSDESILSDKRTIYVYEGVF